MNSRSIFWIGVLIILALAMFVPQVWATPAQNPARQTVPTRIRTVAPPSPPQPPQPTREPPGPPTAAPFPTSTMPRSDAQPTIFSAPTFGLPTVAPISTQVIATSIPGSTLGAPLPTIATIIAPRGSPPANAVTTTTFSTRPETRAPTITIAASSSADIAASGGGVSPFLCGGGVLILLGIGVLLVGNRRER
ncbi:MAG: hypothetical protein L0Y55_05290 [Anaerolineales bacterium]|nr:hypothetical protein [Anaerolineales bacterium]